MTGAQNENCRWKFASFEKWKIDVAEFETFN